MNLKIIDSRNQLRLFTKGGNKMTIAEKCLVEATGEDINYLRLGHEASIIRPSEALEAMKQAAWEAVLAHAIETHTRLCELLGITSPFKEDGVRKWFESLWNRQL